jgi:hypothetical protein
MPADTRSVASEEIYFDYEPTIECILNDLEKAPKAPTVQCILNDLEKPSQNRSWTELRKPESGDYPETVQETWSNLSYDTTRRNRKFLFLGLACLLVVGATLALVLGVQLTQEDENSDLAAAQDANDGENTDWWSPDPVSPAPSITTPTETTYTVPSSSPTTAPALLTAESLSPVSQSSGPTVSPTTEPSSAPSSEPTIQVCTDMIQADLGCYSPQTTINIEFENCNPFEDDWIGIYQDDSQLDLNDLGDSLLWLWTCGSQSCVGQVFVDTLPFDGNLEMGTYVAHLVRRNSGGPYSSYAASRPFDVASTCPV